MNTVLRGNWNYPTTIWAGPGRIAELAAACSRAGIKRPLLVTDEGLVGYADDRERTRRSARMRRCSVPCAEIRP